LEVHKFKFLTAFERACDNKISRQLVVDLCMKNFSPFDVNFEREENSERNKATCCKIELDCMRRKVVG